MNDVQPGILAPVPAFGRYLEFSIVPDGQPRPVLAKLAELAIDERCVVGLGPGLVGAVGAEVAALRPFPALSGPGCNTPSSQADLWCWLRGDARGPLVHASREIAAAVAPDLSLDFLIDGFKHDRGLDLTGYEDGTENPTGEDAVAAAVVSGAGGGLDGSSFVAVQQWAHDLDHFQSLPQGEQDDIIGRRLSDNEELDDAPVSAHVKRTAQESFDPEAFVVRRSMPWSDSSGEGLMFVAFGKSLDAFEAQMRRMVGEEDGITDALLRFSRPLTGSYLWCPPVRNGHLDLTALCL